MNEGGYFGPALPPSFPSATSSAVPDTAVTVSKSNLSSAERGRKPQQKRRHHSSESNANDNSHSSSSSASSSDNDSPGSSKSPSDRSFKRSRETETTGKPSVSPTSVRSDRIIGPTIPDCVRMAVVPEMTDKPADVGGFIGPVIPNTAKPIQSDPESDEDVDDPADLVGPMPITNAEAREKVALDQIEQRANKMKDKLLGRDVPDPSSLVATRETWMTELPPELTKNFGVTARTFSTKVTSSADKDRSAWTDTPADKARKQQELREGKIPAAAAKSSAADVAVVRQDESYRELVDEYNRIARPKSLLEMHADKIQGKSHHHKKKNKKKSSKKKDAESESENSDDDKKKKSKKRKKKRRKHHHKDSDSSDSSDPESSKSKSKKKKKDKKEKGAVTVERRPFDREKDLQIVRMNDAQRKSVIQRSQELTGRFGHGGIQFL